MQALIQAADGASCSGGLSFQRTSVKSLLASTDLRAVAVLLCMSIASPAQAECTSDTDAGDVININCRGADQPKGERGKDAVVFGNHDNDGHAGKRGGDGDPLTWAWIGATMPGRSGKSTMELTSSGGKGGDGGDAGGIGGGGFADGGAAGDGGTGGALRLDVENNSITSGGGTSLSPVHLASAGGNGGDGGYAANRGTGGAGGRGGDGGDVHYGQTGGSTTSTVARVAAVSLSSIGGNGGSSQFAQPQADSAHGKPGGDGGRGGNIDISLSGTVQSSGDGVALLSRGGDGGRGGEAATVVAGSNGGAGGAGGAGGSIGVTFTGSITVSGASAPLGGDSVTMQNTNILTGSVSTAAIRAQSLSGLGGNGGNVNDEFGSGKGGHGGIVNDNSAVLISNNGGTINASGYLTMGVLAQSIGGNGGNGAYSGGVFVARAGDAGPGGNGGTVGYYGDKGGTIHTAGADSAGLLLQSIGGGGGAGGNAHAAGVIAGVGLGGNSGSGGDGGRVTLNNGQFIFSPDRHWIYSMTEGQNIATNGTRSPAMIAQSIGGGGGTAGDADVLVAGFVAVAIGGNDGSGGSGNEVDIRNNGILQTTGAHSAGIIAQSVGGGGGHGGAANAIDYNLSVFAASIALGGGGSKSDGVGGDGGDVIAGNYRQITTQGINSSGLIAQSVGGGGGIGGSSVSTALTAINFEDVPTIRVDYSMGGTGGNGGKGGDVQAINTGGVLTLGGGSHAMVAQSIGGGGGIGGSSDALSASAETANFSATVSLGGKGGNGGDGGAAEATNEGFVATFARDSTAILAQSIGGGGGTGGYGSATDTSAFGDGMSLVVDVGVGGSGGKGGNGGDVSVDNNNSGILTLGDGSSAIVAQSIGGGGGWAGTGNASNTNGQFSAKVGVGGGGGSGGSGGSVGVINTGAIVTIGGAANAIVAQSIGGGGGRGGSGTAKAAKNPELMLIDFMVQGFGGNDDNVEQADDFWEFKEAGQGVWEDITKLKTVYQNYNSSNDGEVPGEGESNESAQNAINVSVGGGVAGKGGAAGGGGDINVFNGGNVETDGPGSSAIFAQSIGGGGGDGGFANATNSTAVLSGSFSVGGKGGSAGDGGSVAVTHNAAITTHGDAGHGIYAQSIGGGGGNAGLAQAQSAAFSTLRLSLGGDGGSNGDGGSVGIDATGSISTGGDDAIAVLAQSIGGGGGTALISTIVDEQEEKSETNYVSYATLIPVILSGDGGAAGQGGGVRVNLSESMVVSTTGMNAYGVFAQSIGGGGGLLLGVESQNSAQTDGGGLRAYTSHDTQRGNGGSVAVTVSDSVRIATSGDGAAGIFAQSLGGGGALIGGLSSVDFARGVAASPGMGKGAGGDINVQFGSAATIFTTGARAHGIVAQALGGGGVVNGGVAAGASDSGCVKDCTGVVSLDIQGSVMTTGKGSYAVVAQSVGNTKNEIDLTIGSLVQGSGESAGSIYLESSGTANVTNNGYVGSDIDKLALVGRGAGTVTNNVWLIGNIDAPQYIIHNTTNAPAIMFTGSSIVVSRILNEGNMSIGVITSNERPFRSIIQGDLVSTGGIVADIDFAGNQGDYLEVRGNANISGTIYVNPLSLQNKAYAVVGATSLATGALSGSAYSMDSVIRDDAVHAADNYLFSYGVTTAGNQIYVTPIANFRQTDPGLNANEAAAATHLSDIWNSGQSSDFSGGFLGLSQQVSDMPSYRATLDSISGASLGAVTTARPALNRAFIANMMSCPTYVGESALLTEETCIWARALGGWVDRKRSDLTPGFDADTKTFQIGAQKEISDDWFVGASAAYEALKVRTRGAASHGRGDGLTLGAVVKHATEQWLFAATLSGGLTRVSNRRSIIVGNAVSTARSTPDTLHTTAHVRAAYNIAANNWYLKPSIDMDVTYVHTTQYAENGSPYALRFGGDDDLSVSISPLVEVGGRVDLGGATFMRPFARAGFVAHASNDWVARASFVNAPDGLAGFRSVSDLPTFTGRLGAGVDVVSKNGLEVKLQYDAELSRGFSSQVGSVRLAYRFR